MINSFLYLYVGAQIHMSKNQRASDLHTLSKNPVRISEWDFYFSPFCSVFRRISGFLKYNKWQDNGKMSNFIFLFC